MKVEFYKHNLNAEDKQACMEVLDSLFLTTGSVVANFEEKLAAYTGNKYAVATNCCTNSLFLSLKSLNIGPGDEVITSPMSFLASANGIERCGATTVFADCDAETGLIDVAEIEKKISPKTKAIIPVHLYGQMADVKRINELASTQNIKVIEDACHAIEGARDGFKSGNASHTACFSFYATKNMTSGDGGAIVCNDEETYHWLKKARMHGVNKTAANRYGKRFSHYDMEFLGYKCAMGNVQASLLLNQVDRMEEYLAIKKAIAEKYDQAFNEIEQIELPAVIADAKHARHIYVIKVPLGKRDDFIHALDDCGVAAAVNYRPIHSLTYYKEKYGNLETQFPNAENIGARCITLPFYAKLTDAEVQHVIDSVIKVATAL